jgi:hypothetical protein
MSGERSSTTLRRLAGKICCSCKSSLPPPHASGEKFCAHCQSPIGCRRDYMYFMLREGWHCQFLEADLKTPLPKKLNLSSSQKVTETAVRGGYNMNLEGRHLASLNGGAIPEAKNLVRIKAKGRLPLRDVALSIRFLEDPVRHPDRNASSRPCSETASRARISLMVPLSASQELHHFHLSSCLA